MKVLFYYEHLGLGGVEVALLNRLAALRRVGVEGHLWFSRFWCDGARDVAHRPDVSLVDRDRAFAPEVLARFDAIVVIDNAPVVEALAAGSRGLARTVYETHASYAPRLPEFYSVLDRQALPAVVVPSAYNRDLVLSRTRVPPERVTVVANCVDTAAFSGAGPVEAGEEPDRPLVLWVGRLEDPKNPRDLIAIAARLASRRPDLRFLVVGDAPDRDDYLRRLERCTEAGLPGSVRFVRSVPHQQMPALYRRAARSGGLHLSTSLYESAPMTIVEAMACGCPVAASSVGGVPGAVEDDVDGKLFPPGDVDRACEIVDQLTADGADALRASLTRAALERVQAFHNPAAIGRQYRSLLESVVVGAR